MPLPTDVEINHAGYMVAPGTYKRTQDGMPEGRTGRIVVRDFFGGQRRALQLERDRSWDAVGVGPAYAGQPNEPIGDQPTGSLPRYRSADAILSSLRALPRFW